MRACDIYSSCQLCCRSLAWLCPASAQTTPGSGTATSPAPAAAATAATAPDPAAPAPASGDIIVTANRRAESVQRSSLAISAFSGRTLESAGVAQAADLGKLTQGLQVNMVGSTSQIYVRGVGDASSNPLANPGVSFNVDGVYVGRPEGVGVNFYDIARLEVLKGPQGTLYGRNSSGGAINLITNSPTFDGIHGALNGEVGNYADFRTDAAINIPLNDVIAIRAAVNRIKHDGYLSDGTSDDDQLAGRLKVLIKPTGPFSLLLTVDGARVRGMGGGYTYLPRRPGSSAWEGTGSADADAYARTFNPVLASPVTPFVHNNFWNVSAQLDYDLGFANLTVIPAYRHTDTDTVSNDAQTQHLSGRSSQETVEARLGHSSSTLKWVAGLYYFHEHNPGDIQIYAGQGLLQNHFAYDPRGTSYSAFGEATYSLTDKLRVIGGARYTSEQRKLDGNFFLSPDQNNQFILIEAFGGQKTFRSATWKAGAEYDLSPRNLLFATASTGFKSGGLTQTVPPDNVYQPEKVLAFEVGSRNRFFDNKLQINLEAFHWTYKDQQNAHLTFDTLGNVNFLTSNAGSATLYGLNLDIVAHPSKVDNFHVAAEYDHSRYSVFNEQLPVFAYSPLATGCAFKGIGPGPFVPLVTISCAGFPLPHAPRWSGEADYTHSFTLHSGASVDLSGSMRFSSKTYLQVDFTPDEQAPSFVKLNANLDYHSADQRYSVGLFVRNLNNAKEYTGGQLQTLAPPLFPAVIAPPRTYGVQAHFNW